MTIPKGFIQVTLITNSKNIYPVLLRINSINSVLNVTPTQIILENTVIYVTQSYDDIITNIHLQTT